MAHFREFLSLDIHQLDQHPPVFRQEFSRIPVFPVLFQSAAGNGRHPFVPWLQRAPQPNANQLLMPSSEQQA